jgi:hypothetical protein
VVTSHVSLSKPTTTACSRASTTVCNTDDDSL